MTIEFGSYGDGAPDGLTRAEVFETFKKAVRHVWRNAEFVLPHVALAEDQPQPEGRQVILAALRYPHDPRPRVIGDHLLQRAPHYELLVHDELLQKDEQTVWRILVHEACHIGIANHGAEFRRLVQEKGGAVSGADALGDGSIKVQLKVNNRFRTIREFPRGQQAEAEAFARAELRLNPGQRYRLEW